MPVSQAERAATRALTIDDAIAEAHTSLGLLRMNQRKWREAEKEYRQAIRLNPGYATAHHWYGWLLAEMGQVEEGLRELQQAFQLDPLSPTILSGLANLQIYVGSYEAAIKQLRRALQLNPDEPHARSLLTRAYVDRGEEPKLLEHLGGEVLSLVNHEHRAAACSAPMQQEPVELLDQLRAAAPGHWNAELPVEGGKQLDLAGARVEDECDLGLAFDALQEGPGQGRLSGPHLTHDLDEAFPLPHAEQEVGQRLAVRA